MHGRSTTPQRILALLALLLGGLLSVPGNAAAAEQLLQGPIAVLAGAGPVVVPIDPPATLQAPFRLLVQNGRPDGTGRADDLTVALNGENVVAPGALSPTRPALDRSLTLQAHNTLTAELTGPADSGVTLTLLGTIPPPALSALEPPVLPLAPGATGTLTATLRPAPTETVSLALTSGDSAIVTGPASVAVPAGQAAVELPLTGGQPGTTTVTATLAGRSLQSTVTVAVAAPALTGIEPAVLSLAPGASGTLTVTIGSVQAVDTPIALATSDGRILGLPPTGSLTMPAGQRTQTVVLYGGSLGSAILTASLGDSTLQVPVSVTTEAPVVVRLRPPVLPLTTGSVGSLMVSLDASHAAATEVWLTVSDPAVVALPADRVTIAAHTLTATVRVSAGVPGMATLTATLAGSGATAAIIVQPPPPTLTDLTCPAALAVGATARCLLTLNAAQPTATDVLLAADGEVQVPPSVTIPADAVAVAFAVTGVEAGSATIAAGPLQGTRQAASLDVVPPPPAIAGLTATAPTLTIGAVGSLTLTLEAAQPTATTVALTAVPADRLMLPPSVTVPAGERSASVPVTGRAPGQSTVTAGPLAGTQAVDTLTVVLPGPPAVTGLTPPALELPQGTAEPLTVTIAPAQPTLTVVPLASSDPGRVEVPSSVPVPAGETSAPFPVVARTAGTATVTAGHLQGSIQQAAVTVRPPALRALAVLPAAANLPQGQTQAFLATGVFTDGSTQDVTAAVTWTSSEPTVATLGAAGQAIGLAPGATTITATLGTLGASASLSVTAPVPTTAAAADPATPAAAPGIGLTASPAEATTISGGAVQYVLTLSSGPGVTSRVALAVSDLPAGVTALLSPQTLGPNQTGTLTLQTADTLASGVYLFTLAGTSLAGGPAFASRQPLRLAVLGGRHTALTGRIVDTQRRPLAGVTLRLLPTDGSHREAVTDAAGAFLLLDPPPGDHLLLVDGDTASTASAKYPTIPVTVTIRATGVTPLHYTPHLHAQKTRNATAIHPTQGAVATDPDLPGVALRIPPGARIVGWDGQANTQVTITTLPLDRLPVPPPPPEVAARTVYMFYFGKRGGGVASRPIPFESPNDLGLKPGDKATLWYFDESPVPGVGPNAWRPAGMGTVSSDGRLIRTDAGVGIPKFCCGSATWNPYRQASKAPGPTCQRCQDLPVGDPVDASTGIFMRTETDLVVPGRVPVVLSRTYRSGEPTVGPFGIGTTMAYDDFLDTSVPGVITYVYRGNAATAFQQQPDGTFTNSTVPGFRGARITVNGDGTRTLREKDGSAQVFDSNGLPIRVQDRAGNTVTIDRSMETNPTVLTEPAGRILTVGWTSEPRDYVVSMHDSLSRTVTYTYDTQLRLTAFTNPAGGVTQYGYDSLHRMTSVTNPRGIAEVQNSYDTNSRVCRQVHADSGTFLFYYIPADQATLPASLQLLAEAAAGGPISQTPCTGTASTAIVTATVVVDPRGAPTTYRFNGQGYLIQQTDALGQVITYTRDPDTNLLLSTTDPLNRVTSYQYDANGNVTQFTPPVTTPLTPPTTWTYESTFNRATSAVDPLGNTTSFEYDSQGNLTAITDPVQNLRPVPDRQKTVMTYNTAGQVLTATDPMGNTTTLTYTDAGDLATVTDPLGHSTTRTYDDRSRVVTQTDPMGRITWYAYDTLDRVTAVGDPLGGVTAFTYDANGNRLTVTDPAGSTTTHEYDARDRLSRRVDPLARAETFGYDGNDNLTTTTDRKNQTTTFTYDVLNRRTQVAYADASVATFIYDAGNRLTQVDDTADPHRPLTRTYDPLDRPLTETTSLGTVAYAADAAGHRTSLTVGTQAPVSYSYDANGQLTGLTQGLQTATVAYDAATRRTLLTLPNGVSIESQYDAASRLTAQLYRTGLLPLGDLAYTYDAAGNRLTTGGSFARTGLPTAVATSAYDAANQQLGFGDVTQTFDANGNLLTQTDGNGTTTYTWDARNRLTALTGPTLTASFTYDGWGRRAQKTVNDTLTDFQYDGVDSVRESSGGDDVTYLRTLAIDEALTRTAGTDVLHYLGDALGGTLALTDATGTPTTSYTYAPFGETTSTGTPSANPVQFTGRENDGTGLYYYRARYYDPVRSRFVSEDPIGLLGGNNKYRYAGNSPQSYVDPFGLRIVVQGNASDYQQAIAYLKRDPGMAGIIRDLETSSTVYTIITNSGGDDRYNPGTQTIRWDPHSALECTGGGTQSPALGLGHEMAHADAPWYWRLIGGIPWSRYDYLEEWRVITGPESQAARTLGEGTREDHSARSIFWVPTPTSR